MQLIGFKNNDQVISTINNGMESLGIDASRGSIARLFGQVIGKEIGDLYVSLQTNHLMTLLSSSEGSFLDGIGALLNCKRDNRDDDEYRDLISKQTLSLASANETSIQLAALSVEGVEDVLMSRFTKGTGSFSLFVIARTKEEEDSVIESVRDIVSKTVAYGIMFEIEKPNLIEIEISVKMMFNTIASEADKITAYVNAKKSIKQYISTLRIGEPLIINEITEQVMKSHENVLNYSLTSIKANGREMLKVDLTPRWNQRFVESSKPEAINVS